MDIIECPHCHTRVVTMKDGTCSSCRKNTADPATTATTEPKQPKQPMWRSFVLRCVIYSHFAAIALMLLMILIDQKSWLSDENRESLRSLSFIIVPPCLLAYVACPIAAGAVLFYGRHGMARRQIQVFILAEIFLILIQWFFIIEPLIGRVPDHLRRQSRHQRISNRDTTISRGPD
jgi:hypothetical protein